MKNIKSSFSRVVFHRLNLGFVVLSLLVCLSVSAQNTPGVTQMCNDIDEAITLLDSRWDTGNGFSITSNILLNAQKNSSDGKLQSSWSIYSFRNNELETIKIAAINNDLKKFSELLSQAYDEYNGLGKSKKLRKLGNWVGFMKLSVSTLPLKVGTLDLSRSMDFTLTEIEKAQTECLFLTAKKIASSQMQTKQKLIAFKYLACKAIALPWVWNYLSPGFTLMAHKGGAQTDMLMFNRLTLGRVANMKNDSKVWREAPRYFPNQLNLYDATSQKGKSGVSIEFSEAETRVTYRIPQSLHEGWLYFEKTSILVDYDTKEQYQVKRIVNGYPLGKTIVLVGCEGKIVEFTLIYPPVKKSMKSFTIENRTVVPVNERDKKRYMQKNHIMSDGAGSFNSQIYKVSDFAK
jgi:hypothetical protein